MCILGEERLEQTQMVLRNAGGGNVLHFSVCFEREKFSPWRQMLNDLYDNHYIHTYICTGAHIPTNTYTHARTYLERGIDGQCMATKYLQMTACTC